MKNFVLILAVYLSFSFAEGVAPDVEILGKAEAFNDKASLLKYYDSTAAELEGKVKDLNEAQLKYKPSEDAWSISQCLEHIIATEKLIFGMVKEILEKPENPERRSEIKVTDKELISGIIDRKSKHQAPAELQPKGTYTSSMEALEDFKEQRKEIKDYINKNKANMRNYVSDSPAGAVDIHQSLLYLSGHTARHSAQIEEIKSQPGFPK